MFVVERFVCYLFIFVEEEIEDLFVELGKTLEILGIFDLVVDDLVDFLSGLDGFFIGFGLFLKFHLKKFCIVCDLHVDNFHFLTIFGENLLHCCFLEFSHLRFGEFVLQEELLCF